MAVVLKSLRQEFWFLKTVLEIDGGDDGKPARRNSVPVTCAFKDGKDGEFELYVYI